MPFNLLRAAAVPTRNFGGLHVNMGSISYFGGNSPVLNILKTAGNYGITCNSTVSISLASPGVVTYTSHNASVGTQFQFPTLTGGAGFVINTTYFVKTIIDANNFTLSATNGGTAINTTTSGTGTGKISFSGQDAWNSGYIDTNGQLISPVPSQLTSVTFNISSQDQAILTNGMPTFANEVWNIKWTGTVLSGSVFSGSSAVWNQTSATTATITNGNATALNVLLTLNIDPAHLNDPPLNIFVSRNKYATNVGNGEFWNPDFLADIKSIGCLRFMDWMGTLQSWISDYSQLADANSFYFARVWNSKLLAPGANSGTGPKGALHPILFCDLLNRGFNNGHINMPVATSNAMMTSFATYMAQNLKSDWWRLEYGNENWNFTGASITAGYCNTQAWPPLGTSAPYQQAVSIVSITSGVNPTVTFSANPFTGSNFVSFNIVGTMATKLNSQYGFGFTPASVTGTTFVVNGVDTTGLTFTSGTCFLAGQGAAFHGYRTAQLCGLVGAAYTAAGVARSRWRGGLGSQNSNIAITTGALIGVNFYLANEAPSLLISDILDDVLVAPYFLPFEEATTITSIVAGNPTTVNVGSGISGNNSTIPGNWTSGSQPVRMFVASGTMASTLNNQNFVMTKITSTQFTIPIDTTGLVASGVMYCADGNFFQLMDDSLSKFTADPVTWTDKYHYFSDQLGTVSATGTCSGGYTPNAATCYTNNGDLSGGLGNLMGAHASVAAVQGLNLEMYEGGMNWFTQGSMAANTQANDYAYNYMYSSCTPNNPGIARGYTASRSAATALNMKYIDHYGMEGGPTVWTAQRDFTDTNTGLWKALMAINSQGVFIDKTAPAPGSFAYLGGHGVSGAGSDTQSINIGATTSPFLLLGFTCQNLGVTSVTVGGVALTQLASDANGNTVSGWWSGVATGLSGLQSVVVTYASSIQVKTFTLWSASNLASTTPIVHATGNAASNAFAVTKGSFIFCAAYDGAPVWTASHGVTLRQNAATALTAINTQAITTNGAYAVMTPSFTDPQFVVSHFNNSGPVSVITFR